MKNFIFAAILTVFSMNNISCSVEEKSARRLFEDLCFINQPSRTDLIKNINLEELGFPDINALNNYIEIHYNKLSRYQGRQTAPLIQRKIDLYEELLRVRFPN